MASAGPVSMALTGPGKDLGLLEYTGQGLRSLLEAEAKTKAESVLRGVLEARESRKSSGPDL